MIYKACIFLYSLVKSHIVFGAIIFWTQFFLYTTLFGTNIFGPNIFRPNIFLEPYMLDPKFFGLKNYFDPNLFWSHNYFGPKISLFFFDPQFFLLKILKPNIISISTSTLTSNFRLSFNYNF